MKKKPSSESYKTLMLPKFIEKDVPLKAYQMNSFRLKTKNAIESNNIQKLSIGKNKINLNYHYSTDKILKRKPKISTKFNFHNKSENKTLINYELVNSCKEAIFNSRQNFPNYKEIINKINKEFKLPNKYKKKPYDHFLTNLKVKNIENKSSNQKKNNTISYEETNANNTLRNKFKLSKKPKLKNILNTSHSQKQKNINEKNKENTNDSSNCILTKEEIEENASKLAFLKKYADDVHKAKIKAKRKRILINAIRYLASNNIKVKEFINNNPFPEKPFEIPYSEEFLDAVKFNNLDYVKDALKKNINFIFQFDHFKQTSFHWAAKLGYFNMLKYLLEHGKTCNLYDKKMRTPLYLASYHNHKKCVQLLLEYGGNAYIGDIYGKQPVDVTTDEKIKDILMVAGERNFFEINGVKREIKNE